MASIIAGYEYDIFISYRQKDNKGDRWVSEFVDALKTELESTFKEEISVYFDINPHDGLLETHDVDASLKEKLKCLIFIPIISRTYCDPRSFAWEHEFMAFVEQASKDQFGLKIKVPNGNVASRVLPVRIHDLNISDAKLCESVLGGVLRGIEFIYKEPGVNKPLTTDDDENKNLNKTKYRIQINKTAIAINEIISGLNEEPVEPVFESTELITVKDKPLIKGKSIIVLPFENISPDPDQEYFSDGLTEEIITDLSHIQDLLVISRSSAMTFKGTKKTVPEIAKIVNVRYVLEGSVRKAGNNLRITAQLIDAGTDTHIWAEKYNGKLNDVFGIQEKVSFAIVNALKIELNKATISRIADKKISDFSVYDIYLKGHYELLKWTEEGLKTSLAYFQKALTITGKNALIYSGLAYAHYQFVNMGITNDEVNLKKAEEYAKLALQIDPESSSAQVVLGLCIGSWGGKFSEGIKYFKSVLTVTPNDYDATSWLIAYYAHLGNYSEANFYLDKFRKIDPLSFWNLLFPAAVHMWCGQFQTAHEILKRGLESYPGIPPFRWYYALNLAYTGNSDEACRQFEETYKAQPASLFYKEGILLSLALKGKKFECLKMLTDSEIENWARRNFSYSYYIATTYAILNEKEKAIDWIENSTKRGLVNYPFINEFDPLINNVRGEERFKKLMEKIKYKWENFEV